MSMQNAFAALAKDNEIKDETEIVLRFMLNKLNLETYTDISQAEIAKTLCLSTDKVATTLALLIEKNLIQKGPKRGQVYAYRITPNFYNR